MAYHVYYTSYALNLEGIYSDIQPWLACIQERPPPTKDALRQWNFCLTIFILFFHNQSPMLDEIVVRKPSYSYLKHASWCLPQLNEHKVLKMEELLEMTQSSYYPPFKTMKDDVDAGNNDVGDDDVDAGVPVWCSRRYWWCVMFMYVLMYQYLYLHLVFVLPLHQLALS